MRSLTIEHSAFIILFALLFALAARIPVDTDTWWHLRSGEHTLTHGMIYADPFSFTKVNEPWINHSWGAQIILLAIWNLVGNFGLAIYVAGLATAGMYFIYRMSPGSVYLRAFTIVIGAAAAAVFWSPRPQMLSFFLSTLILYLLYLHKHRKIDRLWLIPIIMGIWGNLHAGFSIGFIFLFGSVAGEILGNIFNPKGEAVISWAGIGKLIVVTVASVAALVINPYGLQMLTVPFQTIGIGALQNFIQEWNSPNFHERQTWPFIALLLGLLGAAGMSKKRLDSTDFVLASGTAFMALLAGRNIAVFAVVATPILTAHLDSLLTERGWVIQPVRRVTPRMARLNMVLVTVVLLGALLKVLLVLDTKTVAQAQEDLLPVKVTEFLLENRPSGPMFNSYNWGGYLMYFLPDEPVFVDGRTDLYGDDFLTNVYVKTAAASIGWQNILTQYGIRLAVIETDGSLARALRTEPSWQVAYEDEQAIVFTRIGEV